MTIQTVYDPSIEASVRKELDPRMRQMSQELTKWVNQARATTNRASMFDRAAFAAPDNHFQLMQMARKAVAFDDLVGGIAEVTEGLAFDGVKWESGEADEADIFNQMATTQDLDALVRKIHKEEYTYSQAVLAMWWDYDEFTVRGRTTAGTKRKKTFKVFYPKAVTVLDATRVVPVGMMQFGQERLAWQATPTEIEVYDKVLQGQLKDQLVERFYDGRYTPADKDEVTELTGLKVDISRLILLNEKFVHRHTLTKPDFARFPDVRLRRTFKMLDLKQQLQEADRVSLIGAANYILLVKKGDKDDPAYPEEISNLRENFDFIAKLPVIFSDHRLNIEIITPKTDFTLQAEKYDVLDQRIAATCLGLFGTLGGRSGSRSETSLQAARVVARNLENRRHLIRRFLEKHLARAVVEHPNNAGVFSEEPNLTYVPNRVQLDDDTGFAQAIIQLRTMNELSRESVLEYFGFDQAVEAMRRILEADNGMDDTFQTMVPFSSPAAGGGGGAATGAPPAAQGGAGVRGGRPVGGGTPTKNPAKAPAASKSGQQSTKGK